MLAVLFGTVNFSLNASFPVNKKNVEKAGAEIESLIDLQETQMVSEANFEVPTDEALSPAVAAGGDNDMWIALALWFFLGGFAAHRWYAKKPTGWNILFILTLGGLGIWWLVDGINILSDNFI